MSKTITAFFAAWAMPDGAARTAQVDAALSEEVFYADPRTPAALTTVSEIAEYVGQFSKMAPGMPVEATHISTTLNFARATVRFGEGEQAQWGQYTVDLDPNGKIARMIGFVGKGEA